MKRLLTALLAGLLVLGACSGAGEAPTTATPTFTTSTTTTTTSTTTSPRSTTTSPRSTTQSPTPSTTASPFPPDPYSDLPVIVTAADGVYAVSPSGETTQLMDGRVAYAIDDSMGGLLYQIDRGRRWPEATDWDTRVWWLPAATDNPQELLVPTAGHELSLHDAYFDDGIHVVYTRHQGHMADDGTPHDFVALLRSFAVDSKAVTELASSGEWEAGLGMVSCGGGLIGLTYFGQIAGSCAFVDGEGTPVHIPAVVADPTCESDCRIACALGWDGDLMVYTQDLLSGDQHTNVVFVDSQTGVEIGRLALAAGVGRPGSIDLLGNRFLVSLTDAAPRAMLYDLTDIDADPVALPMAGTARFARAPLQIDGTVVLSYAA